MKEIYSLIPLEITGFDTLSNAKDNHSQNRSSLFSLNDRKVNFRPEFRRNELEDLPGHINPKTRKKEKKQGAK